MRVRVTVGVWVRVWVSVRARAQIAAHPLHFLLVGLAQLHVDNGGVRVIERVAINSELSTSCVEPNFPSEDLSDEA